MSGKSDRSTLASLARSRAAAGADDVAWIFAGRETTYGRFDRLTDQVAHGLAGLGIGPGKHFAQMAKNDDTFFELLFGASKGGSVMVPVNWRLAPPEIAYIINDCAAEVLFVGADFVDVVEAVRDDIPLVREIIAIDGDHPTWRSYAAWRDDQPSNAVDHVPEEADVVVQMYSSGTTGLPKGARLTNHGLGHEIRLVGDAMGNWRPDDVNLVVMPLFHIAGSMWGVAGFDAGGRNIIMKDVDPVAILAHISEDRVTKVLLVPAVILFVLQAPGAAEADFSSLEEVVYGASPITQGALRQAQEVFGCNFCQVYGLTETTGAITHLSPADHAPELGRLLSCGKPLPTVEVRIVDEDGKDVETGTVGEVITRSPLNLESYWNLPDATAAAMKNGWFHTGDAGYLDEAGYLFIHDRVKDMIITGGENVYPAEVESVLSEHPAVADVGVVGIPDETWGESVLAFVVPAPEAEATVDDLIAHAAGRIAGFKVPKSIEFVDALPRNPSGKILKRELRKPYWEGHERQV
jgi:acyl-CoA synthetase (AMP-forming)/AMP-acid ligase II